MPEHNTASQPEISELNPETQIMDIRSLNDQFVTLAPESREDMKNTIHELLADHDVKVIDTHNTKSMIFIFTSEREQYGLKIEYGTAKVTRDEAHWYEKAPDRLKKHFVSSAIEPDHAFVILQWFDGAPTIEQLALREGNDTGAIDAYLDALSQDEELFGTYDSIDLPKETTSFFKDKFYTKLKQAEAHPYLYEFLTSDKVKLNGRSITGPKLLVDRLHANEEARQYLSPDRAGFIHGDLHADNLIVDGGNVYLVDPNGIDHLPIEYDHGRVMWSLTGWNAIVRHEHTLKKSDDGSFELEVPIRPQYSQGLERIKSYFKDYSERHELKPEQAYHRALYSSAMQYLSRADHAAVEHEAMALHLRGLEQLDELCLELGIDVN